MIKQKLQELLGVCLDKGVHFDYSAHVNAISIRKKSDIVQDSDYIALCYNLNDWNGTEEQHIAKLDEFIKQVQELN